MRDPTEQEKGAFYIVGNSLCGDAVSTEFHIARGTGDDDYFSRIKRPYLEWRRPLSHGPHRLVITTPVQSKSAEYETLMSVIAERWNRDPEVAVLAPVRVEIWLTHKGENWIGCTNAANLGDYTSAQLQMYVTTNQAVLDAFEAAERAERERERERRRANPVRNPVPVPDNIASDIASYLRLEFGQSGPSRSSIKAKHLIFEGEFIVDGVPTQYWRYPAQDDCCAGSGWATVERFDDTYVLGMTEEPPPTSKSGGA